MWHQVSLKQTLQHFETDSKSGLKDSVIKKRLKIYGFNILPSGKKTQWWSFLLHQFKSPLVYILLIGAILTALLQAWIDMSVILLAVAVNVSVGFWQEFRSSDILEKLREIIQIHALVIRNGHIHEISAANLVPGDIIILKTNRKVPADARIITAHHLKINEAILTGESSPVEKLKTIIEESAVVGDRANMVYMGTDVARGEGQAVVVATGKETEFGKIALMTQKIEEEPTPLQLRISKLGKIIAIFVGIAAFFIFVLGIFENHSFREMLTTAIAVAVAAIPEGLPASISIILAVSAQRILKKKGVVKRLLAAETLGGASVICADKTGTLTEGKMVVEKLMTDGVDVEARIVLALANEAILEYTDNKFIVRGESTDKAKMQEFLRTDGNLEELLKAYPRVSLLPFDPSRKYIASLHHTSQKNKYALFVSGAPEIILGMSRSIADGTGIKPLTKEKLKTLEHTYKELANKGYRMIALAQKTFPIKERGVDLEEEGVPESVVSQLTFVGLVAIRDPIRNDAKMAIREARAAGIKTIMLTGDHLLTAKAIGAELGFSTAEKAIIEGSELDKISDKEFAKRIRDIEIFARINPEHKMRIVDVLQAQGEVVAMTGDGVNDTPALKSADIGIAPESGTDIAKEASDLILLNNGFSAITSAIKQGRIAFDNIRKVTVFLLAGSFTELILIFSALILKLPLPITAVQILWINFVQDTLPGIALSFEPGEKDIMRRPPHKKKEPILNTEAKVIIFIVGIFADLLLVGLFLYLFYLTDLQLNHIRTFIFAALGFNIFFYMYSIKSLRKPIYSYNLLNNPYLLWATVIGVGIMLAAIYIPFLNILLGTVPLPLSNWGVVVTLGIIQMLGIEIVKWLFFREKNKIYLRKYIT